MSESTIIDNVLKAVKAFQRKIQKDHNILVTLDVRFHMALNGELVTNIHKVYEIAEDVVCDYLKIPVVTFRSKMQVRERPYIRARQFVVRLLLKGGRFTTMDAGEVLGKKDHSTIIHARDELESLMETDPALKRQYNEIQELFLRRFQVGEVNLLQR